MMLRTYAALALLAAFCAAGCDSDPSAPSLFPTTTSTASFIAPLSSNPTQPFVVNPPIAVVGTVKLAMRLTRDGADIITAAAGTFTATFDGFPPGSGLTGAHVNVGTLGEIGPVVINLNLAATQVRFPGSSVLATTVPIDATTAQEIVSNPTGFYFQADAATLNVGAFRGQLRSLSVALP